MIRIRIASHAGAAPAAPQHATFAEAGGDIGRGNACTLVLPDPERRISRKQLLVSCLDGRYFVRQVSASVDVELDGSVLAIDVDYPIRTGSELRIGAYLLQVEPALAGESREVDFLVEEPPGPDAGRPDLAAAEVPGAGRKASAALSSQELVSALYAGLKLPAPREEQTAQQLTLIGELLRTAIEGMIKLLLVRTIAKREFGVRPTRMLPSDNNPLKFSPDPHTALLHLLGPSRRGFMEPLDAVENAMEDLRAHELAMLAGMRAALDEILSRFDPEALERRLASKGGWQNLLPAGRKGELWERYCERHAEIIREIEGDFDTLFGRAFLDAYESQLAQFKRPLPPDHAAGER